MKAKRVIATAALSLLAQAAGAMCFEVYAGEQLVYRATQAPVSLAQPLGQTVPARFGSGATMRFFPDESGCTLGAGDSPIAVAAAELGGTGNDGGPARELARFFRDRESGGPSGFDDASRLATDGNAPIELPATAAGRRGAGERTIDRPRRSR